MTEDLARLPDLVSAAAIERYERWLAEQASEDGYLYTDPRVRFEVRDDDLVVRAPDLGALAGAPGTRLEAKSLGFAGDVPLPLERVEGFLRSLDGERTLAEARAHAGLTGDDVRAILRATFGLVLFAPLAVAELERAVASAEIVRFPGSPYEIPRNYWQNMASVRKLVPRVLERAHEPMAALEELRRLHAVTLMGQDEATFHRPASPIARKGVTPSRLWLAPSRTVETAEGTRFVEGPRVGARFLGGDRYGALVSALAGDPGATNDRLEHRDDSGLDWGRVVVARADTDAQAAPWFCPPRPLTLRHVESLFESLARGELADFHQKFMRLHPFRAANQPLAMNVLNVVLAEQRGKRGVGIPHLILDHLSFRLAPEAYRKVFALACDEWTPEGSPAERLRAYAERKRRYYAFIERVENARDDAEARALAREAAGDARLALMRVN